MDAFGKEIDTGDAATGVDGATAEVVVAGVIGADDWGGVLTGIADAGAAAAILLTGEADVAAGIEETTGVVGADDWGSVLTGIVDTGAAAVILLIGKVDVAAGIEETAGVVAGGGD